MGSIWDVFMERVMKERLVSGINVWYVKVNTTESKTGLSIITPEEVNQKFNIGIEKAKDTFLVKTQKGIIHAVNTLQQRYRADHMQLNRKWLNEKFYTDHLLSKTKYLEGKTRAWIYTTGNFTVAYPWNCFSEVGYALQNFANNLGIPNQLRSDLEPEIMRKYTEFQVQVKCLRIEITQYEVERSNQNHAT